MSNTRMVLPREAYEGALSFDEAKKQRQKPPHKYESLSFKIRWRFFIGLMFAVILTAIFGIAYVATQIAIKEYRSQQLEETTRNLEVQISHAHADNLAVRREVFFDSGLKGRLGLEYPALMKYVYPGAPGDEDTGDLVRNVYSLGTAEISWQDVLFGF